MSHDSDDEEDEEEDAEHPTEEGNEQHLEKAQDADPQPEDDSKKPRRERSHRNELPLYTDDELASFKKRELIANAELLDGIVKSTLLRVY